MTDEAKNQAQIAGCVESTATLSGRQYTLSTPPMTAIYAGMVAEWQRAQPDPLETAAKACAVAPPAQHQNIWDVALRQANRKPTQFELTTFVNSLDGQAYIVWTCLQKHHGEEFPTVEDVKPLIASMAEEKLTALMQKTQVVTGEAEAKN